MPEQQPTLRDMIQAAQANGISVRDLEARARAEGHEIGKDLFSTISRGAQARMPTPSKLRGLAAGLGVPYERVRQAAIAEWLPEDDDRPLTAEEREAAIRKLRAMQREVQEAIDRITDSTDTRTPGSA